MPTRRTKAHYLTVRIRRDDKDEIARRARMYGLSQSDYIVLTALQRPPQDAAGRMQLLEARVEQLERVVNVERAVDPRALWNGR